LTTALANIADVDIRYQLVDTAPVYLKESGLILSAQHVRSLLLEPKSLPEKDMIATIRGGLIATISLLVEQKKPALHSAGFFTAGLT